MGITTGNHSLDRLYLLSHHTDVNEFLKRIILVGMAIKKRI